MNPSPDKIINRFGYIIRKSSLTDDVLLKLKRDLTVTPFKMGNYGKLCRDDSFPVYVEYNEYIGIPKYYGLTVFGKPDVDKLELCKYPKYDMQFTSVLRPRQQVIVDKLVTGFNEQRGGLLIAFCGSGKTNMAIYLACVYGLKTLVIVHKTFLKNQFRDRIQSITNIKDVGTIQGKTIDVDHAFVIGMVQSLSTIPYNDRVFKDFGMVIIDEVHHMGSRVFSRVYQRISAKYMLGISAENSRNDRLYKIINWYMGPILHQEAQKPNDAVIVKNFHYKTSNKDRVKFIKNKYIDEPDRSTMITNLIHIKCRNRFIIKLIEELYDLGKNILCLTGRIRQVELFDELLTKNVYMKGNVGKYLGGMKESELAVSATKQVILGTYSMAEEGLDIENLNVVILCTPKSAIKQSVGRILRKDVYEEHPIVIDVIDDDNITFKKQSGSRYRYYDRQHYTIQNFRVADYELDGWKMWDDDQFIHDALTKVPETTPPSDSDDVEFLE